jgi:hypothetical protein
VTSLPLPQWPPQVVYEQLYCARGDMENRLKAHVQGGVVHGSDFCSSITP